MIVNIIGYAAGSMAMISFLPQVIKTFRTKKAGDISIFMLVLTLTTNFLYILYGLILKLYPVIIMLSVLSCIVLIQIVLTVRFRNQ